MGEDLLDHPHILDARNDLHVTAAPLALLDLDGNTRISPRPTPITGESGVPTGTPS
jgi:hypothetical protein